MWTNSLSMFPPCNVSQVEAPSPSDGPGPTSHQWLLIIGLIAQSIKKEVAPLIFFIQTIHNVLSCKWIIKFTEISTQFVSNCILWNPFSFIILIETLFSDRGADWGGETCPLLVCCCENSFLFTHTYFREITSVYGMWGLVTNFKYTDTGQFILTSLRSYVGLGRIHQAEQFVLDLSDSLHSTSVAKTRQVPVDKVSQNLFESLTHIQTVSSFSSSKLSTVSAVLNLMARSWDQAFCEE